MWLSSRTARVACEVSTVVNIVLLLASLFVYSSLVDGSDQLSVSQQSRLSSLECDWTLGANRTGAKVLDFWMPEKSGIWSIKVLGS